MNKAYQTIINIVQHSTCTALYCTAAVLRVYGVFSSHLHFRPQHDAKLILGTCIIIIYSVTDVLQRRLYKMILPKDLGFVAHFKHQHDL